MIKVVAFDMDGVLLDAKEIHYESLNKALIRNGYKSINRNDHESTYDGLPTSVKLDMLLRKGLIDSKNIDKIKKDKQSYTIQLIEDTCSPNEFHIEMLINLQQLGLDVALCSNSIRATVETAIKVTDIGEYFDLVLSHQNVKNPKPYPDIYLKVAEHFEVDPKEILVVEDNENGFKAALSAGCNLLKVTGGPGQVNSSFVENEIMRLNYGE